jgi:O-antigen ligase
MPEPESALAVATGHMTDGLLWITVLATTACFGGRTAVGQLVLAGLAVAAAMMWSLHQLFRTAPSWRPTRTLWLWLAGIGLTVAQIWPLTPGWLNWLSPEHAQLLTLWGSDSLGLFPDWNTLSFDPSETLSGLVTFCSYALVFLVAVQRLPSAEDVERMLKGIACLGIGLAVFALLQYFFSNGLFFWMYRHPTVHTAQVALGTFTNRNHFAQFLAVTVGPIVWWLMRTASAPAVTPVGFSGPASSKWFSISLLAAGLAAVLFAGMLSLSRAGCAAMAIALLMSLVLLARRGQLPERVIPLAFGITLAVGAAIYATRFQALSDRIDHVAANERLTIWAANLRLLSRFPWFGTGVGTHVFTHPLETDRIDDGKEFSHAESGYLQVASECGGAGIVLALLMIAQCLNWCRQAYGRNSPPQGMAAAAAILAGFTAHLLHAWVDFFWYAPACMLEMALLAACACRLAQMARCRALAVAEPVRTRPRLAFVLSTCGLAALGYWMIHVKLPGAAAEPHRVAYLTLRHHAASDPTMEEEDKKHLERLEIAELLKAARANSRDARAQLTAAAAYLQLFEQRQAESENSMSLDQLRDAAIASEFASAAALEEWLSAAVGPHVKYLKAAQRAARKAMRICPLEGLGYIYLSRLDFLRDPQSRSEEPLRQQARTVRPFDALVDFEIGKAALMKGDLEGAIANLKPAFRRSPVFRKEIAAAMADSYTSTEFLEQFEPDWQGLGVVVASYQSAGREEELPLLRERYADASVLEAKRATGPPSEFAWLEAVRMYRDAGRPRQAIQAAESALEDHSQSLALHKQLGTLLMELGEYADAAREWQWVTAHAPDDAVAKRTAAHALREKLRQQTAAREERPMEGSPKR